MKKTQNLNLSLYDPEDKFNVTGAANSLNHNMILIDDAIKKNLDKSKENEQSTQVAAEFMEAIGIKIENGIIMDVWEEG